MSELRFHVGTDVGGTFTDLWVRASDGRTKVVKTPTTGDVISGLVNAVRLAAARFELSVEDFARGIERFGHGTTVGLNALLTGRGGRTAIITTTGFADTLEIGRLRRQYSGLSEAEVSDYYVRGQWAPLVPRTAVKEVGGRVTVDGEVIAELDEVGAREVIAGLARDDVEAVAICTLWATANSTHERRLRELVLEGLPSVPVSVSHDVSPSVGEYARMSTTAANAALKPVASHYVEELEGRLSELGATSATVMLMTGAGGVLPADRLRDLPVAALFSGPSAGVMACRMVGEKMGRRDILTIDTGGTSFDVGLIVDGRPLMTSEVTVAGADIRYPTIDVRSIGAGGGSIASVSAGELHVGPQSAGATPGPACYGRGGVEPTATDADLVLGVLDPQRFIGGEMVLDLAAAREAIETRVAEPLDISLEEAAWGIRAVLDSKMADLLRQVTIARGHDPRDFTLFAGGGSGPSHAWALARELGITEFVVPATATAQSALGTGVADMLLTAEQRVGVLLKPGRSPSPEQIAALGEAVEAAVQTVTDGLLSRISDEARRVEVTAGMRFRGQARTLDVLLENARVDESSVAALLARFEADYERLFGKGAAFRQAGIEVVDVRAMGSGKLPPPAAGRHTAPLEPAGSRPIAFDDPHEPLATAVYLAEDPAEGERAAGPCVIEFLGHTVVVPPGSVATADEHGNLIVRSETS